MVKRIAPLIGRIVLSLIFISSGINKILNFEGTLKYMERHGFFFTSLFLVLAIIIEISGGLSVLFGYKSKVGAWALILFLIPATIIFHSNFSYEAELIQFMKNFAIIGGLLFIAAYGGGTYSLDSITGNADHHQE